MSALNDIIQNINQNDSTNKGSMFETLCLYFLMHDKIYASGFSNVYLWHQWPGSEGKPDTGIDIVAKLKDDVSYCAVQCKFRQDDSSITKAEIDSFLSASSKSIYSQRIIFTLTGNFSSNAENALKNQNPPVKILTLHELEESSIKWEEFSFNDINHVQYNIKTLRPHQINAVDDVLNELAHHDRGKLIMACGTGKTFTSLKIAEKFSGRGGNVLVLVPSISLLSQSVSSWNYDHDENIPLISLPVCSDSTAGYDPEDLRPEDLTITPTTDADSLIHQWHSSKGRSYSMCVIFSTYQSLNVIHNAQAKGFPVFDLIICDEAHRTAGITPEGKSESSFRLVHDEEFIRSRKRLYMTATPKIFGDTPERKAALRKKAEENNAVLYSMDDERIYGPEFHTLSFKKAVDEKLLSDYKVIIFMVEKSEENEPELSVKIEGVFKALAKEISPSDFDFIRGDEQPMKRAVAFSNTIQASKDFKKSFPRSDENITCNAEHIDGTLSARTRSFKLSWLAHEPEPNECRILSNSRCLSEGVDVPALDAVIFLNPRSSQIDIVQSIGRVMRKSEGKKFGYVILPVIVGKDESPEQALDKNERYQTVWKVLQALRAHDERFVDIVNSIDLRDRIRVTTGRPDDTHSLNEIIAESYRQEIQVRMVRRCGGGYWETWINDFVDAFDEISKRINGAITKPNVKRRFDSFIEELRNIINPSIDDKQSVEMLAQHITSKEIFDAIFERFSGLNPISQAMQKMRTYIESNGTDLDPKGLENFDNHIRIEAAKATTGEKKQTLLRDIYNSFFKNAFPDTSEKLGIVYTPLQIVDFILRSADWAARNELGISDGLGGHDLHILDPFSGTGTFTARLIQLGLIPPENLGIKYQNEIHANELLLLAYYISAVNIEAAFSQINGGITYIPFQGMVLADTFRLNRDNELRLKGPDQQPLFYEDGRRAYEEEISPVQVIIGNPPYNVGGKIAGYEAIDGRITEDYAKKSKAQNKKALYDSYVRAIRWAAERVRLTGGIVCYVTNASFIDSIAMDGMRMHLAENFTSIYIFNLRGNQRGDWRKEGEKIFGEGSQCPIAITLFVKDTRKKNHECGIWYYECSDGMTRDGKLNELQELVSFGEMMKKGIMRRIEPDRYGRWITHMSDEYEECFSLGNKNEEREAIFDERYSAGIKTGHDLYSSNFSREALRRNMRDFMPDSYRDDDVCEWVYSPYVKEYVHFSRETIQRVYQMPHIFPKHDTKNLVICVAGLGNKKFSVLMTDTLPSLSVIEISQCFPLYWYEEVRSPLLGTYTARHDGISDSALNVYRECYDDMTITKEDLFCYIYGVLSSREYAVRFGNDTKKLLARVPFVKDLNTFREFSQAGYKLGQLHVNYESVEEWPVVYEGDRSCVRVKKMRVIDRGDELAVRVNDSLVVSGIPSEAQRYVVNGRSALEWIAERYRDDVDKKTGIRNDCNMWGIEHGDEDYIVRLIARVARVSVESVRIIEGMPELGV